MRRQISEHRCTVLQDEVLDLRGLEVVSGELIQWDPFQVIPAPAGVGVFITRSQRCIKPDQTSSEEVLHGLATLGW